MAGRTIHDKERMMTEERVMTELEEHQRKAKADPKAYFRNEVAKWGGRAESNALKCEAAARDCRLLRNDEAAAQALEAESRQWRELIKL